MEDRSLKGLFKVLLFSAVVFGATWFYGTRQPRDHVERSSVTLVAQPDSVYRVMREFARHSTWWTDVQSMERIKGRKRESWDLDLGPGGRYRVEITREIPGDRFVATILNDDQQRYGGKWTFIVSPTGSGTQVTLIDEGWIEDPMSRIVSKLRGGPYRRMDSFLRSLGAVFGETVNPAHHSKTG